MGNSVAGGQFLTREISSEDIFIPEDFTREHKAIAKSVKEFIVGELQSRGDEIEHVNNELSRLLMKNAGEIGLLAADVPEEYDGMALDKISSLIISDKLGEGAGSFTITELNHTGIGTLPLVFFGTKEQKEKYLPGLSSGELIGAFGLTEPDAGSDALNPRTTAVLSEDGSYYLINGTKCFITNAGFGDLIFTFAKVDGKKFTAFIVEFDSPGLSVDAEENKMGMKGTSTRSVIFNNVKVPVENVLGEVGRGSVVAMNALNMGRFKVGAVSMGNARSTFGEAVRYAKQREQFGRSICSFGMIQEKIGMMAAKLFAGESMMYRTAKMIDDVIKHGPMSTSDIGRATAAGLEEYLIECSIMKIFGSETQGYVADESIQIFGGYGYIYENPAELSFRNGRINRIWEGTNEINRLTIANTLFKRLVKERLEMESDLDVLRSDLKQLEPVKQDDGSLDLSKQMLATGKGITRYVVGLLRQVHGKSLGAEQELAGMLSDMLIELYAFESAYLRAVRLSSGKKARNGKIAAQIVRYFGCRLYDRLISLSNRILPAVCDADSLGDELSAVSRLLAPPPVDTIRLLREIADDCVAKKGYPFKLL